MSKDKTGRQNGFRVIYGQGCIEPKSQKAKTQAKMFQFLKTKKKGRRK